MNPILEKYARLLVNYCLEIKPGDRLYIRTSTLAEPLVREVFREATRQGGQVEVDFDFRERDRIFMQEANEEQLRYISPLYQKAMEEFEAYLYIRAPFNLREDQSIDPEKRKIRGEATAGLSKTYFQRTATRELKRNLCQYPTDAAAQNAGMSLEEYEAFVFGACHLFAEGRVQEWLNVRKSQQQIVDFVHLLGLNSMHLQKMLVEKWLI